MPFYNQDWNYSAQDIDIGDLVKKARNFRRLKLRMRRQVVDRDNKVLWQRSSYYTADLKENWGGQFRFKIERNPVAGIYYKELTGYVLWRTWYRLERTPTGGLQSRRDPDEQLVAVVLNGSPVYRLPPDHPTVTNRMREEFREAFSNDVVPYEDLLTR